MSFTRTEAVRASVRQKVNASVPGRCNSSYKSGFTLIELMIAIAILALLSAAVIPLLRPSSYIRDNFIEQLNSLSNFGWQQAIIENRLHRVFFDLKNRVVRLEHATDEKDRDGQPLFAPPRQAYTATTVPIPSSIKLEQIIVEGFDELKRFGGGSATVWFFIVPEGLAQTVTVNFVDKNNLRNNKPRPFGLVLNPYSAQFKVHYAFQK